MFWQSLPIRLWQDLTFHCPSPLHASQVTSVQEDAAANSSTSCVNHHTFIHSVITAYAFTLTPWIVSNFRNAPHWSQTLTRLIDPCVGSFPTLIFSTHFSTVLWRNMMLWQFCRNLIKRSTKDLSINVLKNWEQSVIDNYVTLIQNNTLSLNFGRPFNDVRYMIMILTNAYITVYQGLS